MNMQAMMKQAQKLQNDMMNDKKQIDLKIFEGKSSLVSVTMNGKKELLTINISDEAIDINEKEMLEDMVLIAINDVLSKIDKETEEKMCKYTKTMPGLF